MSANDKTPLYYKKASQHWDRVVENEGLDVAWVYFVYNATAYLERHRKKHIREDGTLDYDEIIKDLSKAEHYCAKLKELYQIERSSRIERDKQKSDIPNTFSEEIVEGLSKRVNKERDKSKVENLIHQLDHNSHVFVPKLDVAIYTQGTYQYSECHFCGTLSGSMLAKQPCTKRPSSEDQMWIEKIKQEMYASLEHRAYYQIDTTDDPYITLLSQWYYKRMSKKQVWETIYQSPTHIPSEYSYPIGRDGKCMCHQFGLCPLGKRGVDINCTYKELEKAGYKTHSRYDPAPSPNSSSQRNERVFDNHGFAYYQGDGCETGDHVWEPLPDYEAGNICIHCGIQETK